MNTVQQVMNAFSAPGLLIIIVLVILASAKTSGWISQFITALNLFTTPWIAILVVVIGMIYNIKCKLYGLPSDSANQVIGAGIGLLTGRALANHDAPPAIPNTTQTMTTATETKVVVADPGQP